MTDLTELTQIEKDHIQATMLYRLTQLHVVTATLSEAITPLQVANVFIDEGAKTLDAAYCTVARLYDEQTIELLRSTGYGEATFRTWQRHSINSPLPIAETIRTRQPIWLASPQARDERFPLFATVDPVHRAWAILPLIVKDRIIGGIGFGYAEANSFNDDAKALMTVLALQCAQALDRAHLYEKEQLARADAEKTKQQMTMLAQAGVLLTETLDYETTLKNLSDVLIPAFADSYVVDVVDQTDQFRRITLRAIDKEAESALEELTRRYPPDHDRTNIGKAYKTQKAALISNAPPVYEQFVRDADHLRLIQKVNVQSQISLPLIARNQIIGVISIIMSSSGRRYTEDDLPLAEELARRVAHAVDHARLYEAEQRARQEAEEAVQVRNEFLSIAAHELKTPVTSLRGFAQLLLRQLNKKDTLEVEQLQRSLTHIDEQTAKLTRLVNALLDLSRLQAGRLTLEPKMIDLVKLVTQTIDTVQRTTQMHTITLHAPATLPLLGDPLRLEQVLINLLDNAVKYSPDGGLINVSVVLTSPQMISISITDRGLGIAPEYRSRIFDRFFQAHREGYRGGMGLGLHISHQIMELHDGTIAVEFPDEGGTRFIINLPLKLDGDPL
jgi:K+-sensing histidine kinase KdpD